MDQLPLPVELSSELKKAITELIPVDLNTWQQISPSTSIEWESLITQLDEAEIAFVRNYPGTKNLSIEPDTVNGVPVYRISPASLDEQLKNYCAVLIHGGAYISGSGEAGLSEAVLLADQLNIQVLAIDYSMPPIHPFPAGLDDVVNVYSSLLNERPASSILFGGSSAGGGLTLAAIHQLKSKSIELPGAVLAATPWSDLTKNGDSYYTNQGFDRILRSYEGPLAAAAKAYAASHDMKSPLISPIYGDFNGFPPVLLVSGSRDLFLSCTIRTHTKLRQVGIQAELHVFEGQSHGDYALLIGSAETKLYYTELLSFMLKHLY